DGLCCYGQGYYQIKLDGNPIIGPVYGNFGSSATHIITVGGAALRNFDCMSTDPALDSDSDGTVNYKDPDYCTLNAAGVCTSLDKDSDGIPDFLDLDSDNDGIPDLVEAGGADDDGDGRADNTLDTDQDGLVEVFETAQGSSSSLFDTDGDGIADKNGDFDGDGLPNWLDLDADGDGITDNLESGGNDSNHDGIQDDYLSDLDGDGYADSVDGDVGNDGSAENSANSLVLTSSDSNADGSPDNGYPHANMDKSGYPNFLDIDADNDGIVDNSEAQATSSYIPPSHTDKDQDGIDDAYDNDVLNFGGKGLGCVNTDNNGEPDFLDLDSDDDAQLDIIEGHDMDGDESADNRSPANIGNSMGYDMDGDGLDDGYDNDTASKDPTNSSLQPSSHPNHDGGADRDWRIQTMFPVEWVSFEADWQADDVKLSWETAVEINSSHFLIQRKVGSQSQFTDVGRVEAKGNSNRNEKYAYLDSSLPSARRGDKISYRLKQIDLDGKFEYSKIEELILANQNLRLEVYPNPATERINVDLSGTGQFLQLKILSMNGKVIYQKSIKEGSSKIQVEVNSWAKAYYILQLESEDQLISKKLLVK
ncbi:MAG: T9SS type A sorting domain-containing protein, partial [Bacteroidota bacterium]